ncbi:MAG: hypothetical protein AB4352_18040 [Hormoscilla sp.]
MMDNGLFLSERNICEQFSHFYHARKVTNNDLQRWKSIRFNPELSDEEVKIVTRLLHAVKRGWLEVVEV